MYKSVHTWLLELVSTSQYCMQYCHLGDLCFIVMAICVSSSWRSVFRRHGDLCFIVVVICVSSAGLVHSQLRCHGCLVEGIAGMLWKCVKCFEYHLCTPCYAAGKHSVEHSFHRIDAENSAERLGANKYGWMSGHCVV